MVEEDIPFPDRQFDVVMCSFMIFPMPEEVRTKGIAEIYRILKPGGRLLEVDVAEPAGRVSGAFARMFLGGMLEHDLRELLPVLKIAGFAGVEFGQLKFRIFGLSVLAFVRGCAQKG